MTRDEINEIADNYSDDPMLTMDDFDDCIVGVVSRFGMDVIFCYSTEKVLQKLMDRDGMSREEAEEFFEYNQIGAWMGKGTPCFISHMQS